MLNQKQEIEAKTSEVQRLCNGKLPTHNDFAYKAEFNEISSLNLEQIREAVIEFQARLECMRNVDSEVKICFVGLRYMYKAHYYLFITQTVNEFRRRQVEVEELKKVIAQKNNQERNVDDKILSLYNEWEPKLNQLVETISRKFSDFMESISYVGEVVLSRKEKVYFFLYFMYI